MVTRKEVAELAGVSVAAVSYVINNKGGVSEATRLKITQAIETLGYKPSYAARMLKAQKTNHLTVLINYLGDPFEAGLLIGLESRARERGYFIDIQTYSPEWEDEFIEHSSSRIDGVILLGQSLRQETLDALHKQSIPLLSIGKPCSTEGILAYVDIDWVESYTRLIRHLLREGYRKIRYMNNGTAGHIHEMRREAFHHAVKNIQAEEAFIFEDVMCGSGRLEAAYQAMIEHLSATIEPEVDHEGATAYVAASDLMAGGMLHACSEKGRHVPNGIGVAASENILMMSIMTPSVTALDYPRQQAGSMAIDLMVDYLHGEPVENQILSCDFHIRDSTLLSTN